MAHEHTSNSKKYLPFEQDGKIYNLYDLPKGFVIKGDLHLYHQNLTELPDLSDVVVKGNFDCFDNELTSLEGAPKEVGGNFSCFGNRLTSLEGAPKTVGGYFSCSCNQLTSLEGAPQKVSGDFYCDYNRLTSLDGASIVVGGDFYCESNQLTSLVGVPQVKNGKTIICDDSIGDKYGFSDSSYSGIPYEDLCKSPLYRSEEAMNRVRIKQQQEQMQQQQEKINAEFSQWLKNNANKPTRE